MSGIQHLISPKASDVGFPVQRLLPAAQVPAVGPFVFFDHMGPARFARAGTAGDVRPHPHIGLATVTYLYAGALIHRDSLGSVQRIEPGAINLMAAGLALPAEREEMAPAFHHYPADALPAVAAEGVSLRLLIGAAFGLVSPVVAYSPTWQADVELAAGAELELPSAYPERGVYLAEGRLRVAGTPLEPGQLAVLTPGPSVRLEAETAVRLMIVGGAPLDGRRFLYWNFVARRRERIETAKADWAAGRFVPVPGETECIPPPWLS